MTLLAETIAKPVIQSSSFTDYSILQEDIIKWIESNFETKNVVRKYSTYLPMFNFYFAGTETLFRTKKSVIKIAPDVE